MLKTILTLLRGRAATAAERLADENALAILDQQMREASAGYERARRSLALASAQSEREDARLAGIVRQIGDLETRVAQALDAGAETAALEGAEAIATLEADRDASREAQSSFKAEAARLQAAVQRLAQRLADLERGRRIARAADAVSRTRVITDAGMQASVADAEATLTRLRERQSLDQAEAEALETNDPASQPGRVAEKLAEAGFGPRLKPCAADVLARLRAARAPTAA